MENLSTIAENSSVRIYKFGNCCLNTVERQVFKDKQLLTIASRAFDILQLLIERQGEVVSKDEILDAVWRDSFVEEGNLTVYVSKLRKSLGANKTEPFIETVSGIGYRFVSRVTIVDENDLASTQPNKNKLTVNNLKHNSIAVLPLDNENGDEEIDYLTDGITESLINNLSYLPNLRVISRNTVFRYKDKDIDIPKIGKELGVSTILTGRIRIIRDNLVLSVELTNSEDNNQLWGTQINQPFKDIFEVQEKITQSISENLKTQISQKNQSRQTQIVSHNSESYKYYLKGKYILNKRTTKDNIDKAIDCFQMSISKDPSNTHSYIELANCYKFLHLIDQLSPKEVLNQVEPLLKKASALNKSISEFYVLKGYSKMFWEFNTKESEINFKQALRLNPNSLLANIYYSKLLVYCGKFSKAINYTNECIKLDPISIPNNKHIAKVFYCMEQFHNALNKLEECLDLESNDFETLLIIGGTLVELKKHEKAIKFLQQSLDLQYCVETVAMIGYAKAKVGKYQEAKRILKKLEKISENKFVPTYYQGAIYAALENKDKAFECLEIAIENKYSDIIALKADPKYKPIRNDPRFNKMLLKIGLPID